jgi:nucleotide-binding universal stress UspA family protein
MAFTPYRSLADETVDRVRTFVAVVDDTPECRLAMRLAAARAAHTVGGAVTLVHVISPLDFVQWGGVQDMMEQEAQDEAHALLDRLASELESYSGLRARCIVLAGKTAEQVMQFLRNDDSIVSLVLGASAAGEPGPLVTHFASVVVGGLPCTVTVVPGSLNEAQIDAMA